jgi:hypothetical protein
MAYIYPYLFKRIPAQEFKTKVECNAFASQLKTYLIKFIFWKKLEYVLPEFLPISLKL